MSNVWELNIGEGAVFRIKVCGVTSALDAEAIARTGVDAIGLNFYEGSSRYLEPTQARDIVCSLDASVLRVGVFVDATAHRISECVEAAGLGMIQLHGDESPEFLNALDVDVPVIRAFRVKAGDEARVREYLEACAKKRLAGVLIDAAVDGQFGGTGQVADWEFVARLRSHLSGLPIILAGGLTAENVGEAVAVTDADAVDSASGVESSAGIKDHELVRQFADVACRAFERSLGGQSDGLKRDV